MSHWISSTPIPIKDAQFYGEASHRYGVKIGTNIWIIQSFKQERLQSYIVDMFVFRTGNHQVLKVDCTYPNDFCHKISSLASSGSQIYFWTMDRTIETNDHAIRFHRLHKLDTRTMEWEFILDFRCKLMQRHAAVIEDHMFVLMYEGSKLCLVKFSLSEKKEIRRTVLCDGRFRTSFALTVHAKQLYLMTYKFNRHTVSKIDETNGLTELSVTNLHSDMLSKWENGRVFCCGVHNDGDGSQLFMSNFNFSTNTWESTMVGPNIADGNQLRVNCSFEIDGIIYAVMTICEHVTWHGVVCTLELEPKLSSICMLRIFTEADPTNIKRMRKGLTLPLRDKFQDMIHWKEIVDRIGPNRRERRSRRVI